MGTMIWSKLRQEKVPTYIVPQAQRFVKARIPDPSQPGYDQSTSDRHQTKANL